MNITWKSMKFNKNTKPLWNGTRIMIAFWKASRMILNEFLIPTWPPRGVNFVHKTGNFWLLGPSWGQDGPKRPQEAPKTASKTDFGHILVHGLTIFLFFSWFGGLFRFLLFIVLLVCCFVGLLTCWSVGLLLCWSSRFLVVCWSVVWP